MKWLLVVVPVAACSFGDNTVHRESEPPDASTTTVDAYVRIDVPSDHPDAPPPPPPACGLVPQSGCSGSTPACDIAPADDGTVACRAVTKQGVSNSHCALTTDCRQDYTCVADGDANDAPWCSRFCEADADCVGVGSRCVDSVEDGTVAIPICSHACDLYDQTGCPSGMGCIGDTDAAGNYSDCEYMGSTPDGDACTHAADCMDGSTCVTTGATTVCEAYCLVGDDSTCDGDLLCDELATPLIIGAVEYGVCE